MSVITWRVFFWYGQMDYQQRVAYDAINSRAIRPGMARSWQQLR